MLIAVATLLIAQYISEKWQTFPKLLEIRIWNNNMILNVGKFLLSVEFVLVSIDNIP